MRSLGGGQADVTCRLGETGCRLESGHKLSADEGKAGCVLTKDVQADVTRAGM